MDQLIKDFRNAKCSWNLWNRSTGINEFDLVYDSGVYYLFVYSVSSTGIYVRQSSTIEGLYFATETQIISGNLRYPTAVLDSGVWHVMGFNAGNGYIEYFTSANSSVTSTYTFQGQPLPQGYTDPSLRYNSNDSKWVLAAKGGISGDTIDGTATAFAWAFTADTIGGTYTAKGMCIPMNRKRRWHRYEEADPDIFIVGTKIYLLFSAYDGIKQRASMCELDANYQLTGDVFVICNPLENWQTPTSAKIFNPVYQLEPDGSQRIYFAKNVAFAGVPALTEGGWAYLQVRDTDLWSGKVDTLLFGTNFLLNRDDYTGNDLGLHGSYSVNNDGIMFNTNTGGAYGYTGAKWLGDFTLKLLFTPGNASGDQWLFSLGDKNLTNFFGLFLDANNNLQYSWGKVTTRKNISYVPSGLTKLVIRKIQDRIEIYANGRLISEFNETVELIAESYRIGNKYGFAESAAEQFVGTIKEIELYNEIVRLDSI